MPYMKIKECWGRNSNGQKVFKKPISATVFMYCSENGEGVWTTLFCRHHGHKRRCIASETDHGTCPYALPWIPYAN
jgi:hypothetical protein